MGHVVTLLFLPLAPSSPPLNVSGSAASATSLLLSWSPPPDRTHNGMIRMYSVRVVETDTGFEFYHDTTDSNTALNSLHPYYTYACSVAAVTVAYGPYSESTNIQTKEDGKCFFNNHNCSYCY